MESNIEISIFANVALVSALARMPLKRAAVFCVFDRKSLCHDIYSGGRANVALVSALARVLLTRAAVLRAFDTVSLILSGASCSTLTMVKQPDLTP